jgi:hypothetical protein
MFRLLLPDLRAESDQPFIFGCATMPIAHVLRLARNRIGSISALAAIAPSPARRAGFLFAT